MSSINESNAYQRGKRDGMKKHTNLDQEIYTPSDEDKWWKIGANILLFMIVGFAVAHAVRYFVFIA